MLSFVTGIVYDLLLQKGQIAKYRVIVGQFLLRAWTVVKIMGTAVVVGAIGIYALLPIAAVTLHINPLLWLGVVVSGCCFGAGRALFGYCPGRSTNPRRLRVFDRVTTEILHCHSQHVARRMDIEAKP